jgi:hypothetical protein
LFLENANAAAGPWPCPVWLSFWTTRRSFAEKIVLVRWLKRAFSLSTAGTILPSSLFRSAGESYGGHGIRRTNIPHIKGHGISIQSEPKITLIS